jgi:hypothetical protein
LPRLAAQAVLVRLGSPVRPGVRWEAAVALAIALEASVAVRVETVASGEEAAVAEVVRAAYQRASLGPKEARQTLMARPSRIRSPV